MKQSIKNNSTVIFNFHDMEYDFEEIGIDTLIEGSAYKVNCLASYTELGNKDYEYYDITHIETGEEFEAISGYHLTETILIS